MYIPLCEFKQVTSFVDMFEGKVDKECDGDCWEWVGTKTKQGYGQFLGQRTHRIAYELYNETNIGPYQVLHTCDNPSCVNPEHLFLGTHTDNMADMKSKGRSRNGATGKLEENRSIEEL